VGRSHRPKRGAARAIVASKAAKRRRELPPVHVAVDVVLPAAPVAFVTVEVAPETVPAVSAAAEVAVDPGAGGGAAALTAGAFTGKRPPAPEASPQGRSVPTKSRRGSPAGWRRRHRSEAAWC